MSNGEDGTDERAAKLANRFGASASEGTEEAEEAEETQSPSDASNASQAEVSDTTNTDKASNASQAEESDTTNTDKASNAPSTSHAGEAGNASGMDEASEASQAETEPQERPVRELETKLLYLDDEFLQELELTFDELNLRYKREYGEELQKNRDYYPTLLQLGLEQLGDVREQDLDDLEGILDR